MILARKLGFAILLGEWGTDPYASRPLAILMDVILKPFENLVKYSDKSTWMKFAQRIRLQDAQLQESGAVQDKFNLHTSEILQQCNFRQYLKQGSGWEHEPGSRQLLKMLFNRCLPSFPPSDWPAATGPSKF